jgi:hypothetical protein
MPIEPLEQTRNGGKRFQESFLVEARAISGFSGSPVFLMLMRLYNRQGGNWPPGGRDVMSLLGIVWGYIKNWEPVCDPRGKPLGDGSQVFHNTGMMGVVPAWKLQEILDSKEVQDFMKNAEDAYHKTNSPPTTGLAGSQQPAAPAKGEEDEPAS